MYREYEGRVEILVDGLPALFLFSLFGSVSSVSSESCLGLKMLAYCTLIYSATSHMWKNQNAVRTITFFLPVFFFFCLCL